MEKGVPNTYYPSCHRIVVLGDVHGDLNMLMQALRGAGIINQRMEWIAQPKDTMVIQLGDQVDSATRGNTDNWERIPDTEVLLFMNHLSAIASVHGGSVISLLGNHELMNVMGMFDYVSPTSMNMTGGQVLRSARFSPGGDLALLLSHRPVIVRIGSFVFCHAGILPYHVRRIGGRIDILNAVVHKFLRKLIFHPLEVEVLKDLVIGMEGILWTRAYSENPMSQVAQIAQELTMLLKCKSVLVGHSVVSHITPYIDGKIWFLDTGMSRSFGERDQLEVLEIWNDGEITTENQGIPYRILRIPVAKK